MKVAIVASPRTGSTWLYDILLQHLRQTDPDFLALEEYFNVEQLQAVFLPKDANFSAKSMTIFPLKSNLEHPSGGYQLVYRWDENGIRKVFVPFTQEKIDKIQGMIKAGVWSEYRIAESRARLEWLKKDPRKTVLVKVMAEDLEDNPELADYLSQNFKIIFLKRENLINQIQSYGYSMASGVWHSGELALEKLGNQPIPCQKVWVDQILNQVSHFSKWRDKMTTSQSQEVSYEQLCEFDDSKSILKFLGFEYRGKTLLPPFTKQPKPYQYFSNNKQLLSWLNGSEVAVITSPEADCEKLCEILREHQRRNNSKVIDLGEYLNMSSLRYPPADGYQKTYQWGPEGIEVVRLRVTPEMTRQMIFMDRIGAWPGYRAAEAVKRIEWLNNDKHDGVLMKVMAQDFEENPKLAEHLTKNFRVIFFKGESSRIPSVHYLNVRARMNGPQYPEVSHEQLEAWGDPDLILKNLGIHTISREILAEAGL